MSESVKIFVLVPYMDRSDEEIQRIREEAAALYEEQQHKTVELCVPHGKRLAGDIEAMFAADVVLSVKYSSYDPVCQIVQQAAYVYGKEVYEDRFIPVNDEILGLVELPEELPMELGDDV